VGTGHFSSFSKQTGSIPRINKRSTKTTCLKNQSNELVRFKKYSNSYSYKLQLIGFWNVLFNLIVFKKHVPILDRLFLGRIAKFTHQQKASTEKYKPTESFKVYGLK